MYYNTAINRDLDLPQKQSVLMMNKDNNKHDKCIETERLILRPTNFDDTAFIVELLNMPKWLEFIGDRKVKTVEDAGVYIKTKLRPQIDRLGCGNFTIIQQSDGIKVGTCGLYDREGIDGVDIGFAFAFLPAFEKRGFAYESSIKPIKVAVEKYGIKKISAITLPNNKPSQKLLEKLGLRFIKMTKVANDDNSLLLYQNDF
jgi:RimJ/RimL family protein N-acetyltransferase